MILKTRLPYPTQPYLILIDLKLYVDAMVCNHRTVLQQMKQKLHDIQISKTYKFKISINNWDTYFNNTKNTLVQELENLKTQINEKLALVIKNSRPI